MKKETRKFRILAILAMAISLPLLMQAQSFSEKREQSKSFRLKPGTIVQVFNKYGNVNVIQWEKDSVRFDVSLSAQSKQASRVEKILSSIDCEMIATAGVISARTVFHDNSATFWKDVVSYAGKVVNASNNLQINYTVYMPVTSPLKIDNKFGNIYLDSQKGRTDITLSNGDLQARDFSGNLKLTLEFGSASIQEAIEAQININYSDLYLQKVNRLNLVSRSSTLDLEEVGSIELESVRDKISIKSSTSVSGNASFSRIRINELVTVCSLNTKYGELKINGITRNFITIYINSEYTDVMLGINPLAAFTVDLIYDAKTILNIAPNINKVLKKETINPKFGTIKANGETGKSSESQITITAKAGSLSLLNK
jgi:hypothetical protein